jgi:hypothetical protein
MTAFFLVLLAVGVVNVALVVAIAVDLFKNGAPK